MPRGQGSLIRCTGVVLVKLRILFYPYWRIRKCRENADAYAAVWAAIAVLLLALMQCSGWCRLMAVAIAIYRLCDLMHGILMYMMVLRNSYSLKRTLAVFLANWINIVACFAVLFLAAGKGWKPLLEDPLTAAYQSAMTIATVGYGDIHPLAGAAGACARALVLAEIVYGSIFALFAIPTALAAASAERRSSNGAR